MIPKNTFADGLWYAAMIAGEFDPFTAEWSEEEQRVGERVLDLLYARLNAVAEEYAVEVRVGGQPPELEIGMVVVYSVSGSAYPTLVCATPCVLRDVLEVRAPWGGPVIWRAK